MKQRPQVRDDVHSIADGKTLLQLRNLLLCRSGEIKVKEFPQTHLPVAVLRCKDRRALLSTTSLLSTASRHYPTSKRSRAKEVAMAPSTDPAESQQLLNETSSLVAVEGEKGLKLEPIGGKLLRWFLGALLWVPVVFYVALMIVFPTGFFEGLFARVAKPTISTYYGFAGAMALLWSGPVLLLVFCGALYLYLFPRSSRRPMKKKSARATLGSHPLIVSGPFGVVSTAELLCILAFTALILWIFLVSTLREFHSPSKKHPSSNSWLHKLKAASLRFGIVGQICLGFLFLPVARGSVLLRLLDIPFEHAAKYHVWLGHFTMSIFSLHGFGYCTAWFTEGALIEKLLRWKIHGVANLAGAVALMAGLLMWMTSFRFTRIRFFELFFYTHQLYIVFVVFMALHIGDVLFGIPFAGILLFTFDRFLRFCQSRKEVHVLSAKVLPCGTFELVLPKPSNLQYNALSFVFLNIPLLGRCQWHPFSVSSSPKDSPDNMKFLIKPLGTWTRQLNAAISKAAIAKCPLSLTAAVEGPYGHESSYFLNYDALLLVAGGIGVSPFVAILRDLLQRYQINEPHLPQDVTLIWAVKSHKELAILDSLSPVTIFPEYASKMSLTVKAYVTQEVEEDLEAGEEESHLQADLVKNTQAAKYNSGAAQKSISHLVGSGDILWVGVAIAASLVGYLTIAGLVGKFYLIPVDNNSYKVVPWSVRGAILCLSVLFGVWFFGGSVILLWHLVGSRPTKKLSARTEPPYSNSQEHATGDDDISLEKLVQHSNTLYGSRPDLQEAFEGCAKRLSGTNVGVLVCGPQGLQSSVASQCRAFNTANYSHHKVAFSYHSVSFDL